MSSEDRLRGKHTIDTKLHTTHKLKHLTSLIHTRDHTPFVGGSSVLACLVQCGSSDAGTCPDNQQEAQYQELQLHQWHNYRHLVFLQVLSMHLPVSTFSTTCRALRADQPPIDTWSSWPSAVGILSTDAGWQSPLFSDTVNRWIPCR